MKTIRIENSSKLFFTSDHHFDHFNIIRYCDRPFKTVTEMNEELIKRWNAVVEYDDSVIYLGDFSMEKNWDRITEIWHRLNGNIIAYIYGNHDKKYEKAVSKRTTVIPHVDMLRVAVRDEDGRGGLQHIICSHYPQYNWDQIGRGTWHLYAHEHGNINHPHANALDVGVDCWDLYPPTYGQIKERMKTTLHKKVNSRNR